MYRKTLFSGIADYKFFFLGLQCGEKPFSTQYRDTGAQRNTITSI